MERSSASWKHCNSRQNLREILDNAEVCRFEPWRVGHQVIWLISARIERKYDISHGKRAGGGVVVAQVREGKCVDAAATFSITQPFPSACRELTIKYLGGRKENAQMEFCRIHVFISGFSDPWVQVGKLLTWKVKCLVLLDISAQTLTKSEDGRQCVQEAENSRRSVRRLRLPSLSPTAAAGKSFHQGDLH